jgi:hypothetical protein
MTPPRLQIGVDLTYACNYKCPYCVLPPLVKHRRVEEWTAAFERIRSRHGNCYINLSGGEPSIYPGFYDLVRALARDHVVDLCTNLSWPVEKLIPELGPDRLRLSPSFHPTQSGFDDFLERLRFARPYVTRRDPSGRPSVNFVCDPPQMAAMSEFQRKLEKAGFSLLPLPLMVDGHLSNSKEEKSLIAAASPFQGTENPRLDFQLGRQSPRGRLCGAGSFYALVRGDGGVDRCSRYKGGALGNFFSEDFRLWDGPTPCSQDWCPYESAFLMERV